MRRIKQPHGGTIVNAEKGETANPNGRPRKLFSHVLQELKEMGIKPVKPVDIVDAYENLLNLPESDIDKIIGDEEKPYFIRLIATEMRKKNGRGFEVVERMLNRVHGMPKQSTDLTTKGDKINILNVTVADKETGDVLKKLLNAEGKQDS